MTTADKKRSAYDPVACDFCNTSLEFGDDYCTTWAEYDFVSLPFVSCSECSARNYDYAEKNCSVIETKKQAILKRANRHSRYWRMVIAHKLGITYVPWKSRGLGGEP